MTRSTFLVLSVLISPLSLAPAHSAVFPCAEQGILDAIATGGGPHTFSCVGPTTVTTSAIIEIDRDVTLDAEENLIIDGDSTHGAFRIQSGIVAELRNLQLIRGRGPDGGAISILPEGELTLTNCQLSANTGTSGGAIYTRGALTLVDTDVSNNMSLRFGGGIAVDVGATVTTLINSTVSFNSARSSGGGIEILEDDAVTTLVDSRVSDNRATFIGRGFAGGLNLRGTVTLVNSTVSGNSAAEVAGGILSDATLTITNSSITGNTAHRFYGGGLYLVGGRVTIEKTTVSYNSARLKGGGIASERGSPSNPLSLVITNSTISDNFAPDGTGGGIDDQLSDIALVSTTIAGNTALGGGSAVSGRSSNIRFANTIVAGDCLRADGMSTNFSTMGGNIESLGDTCGFVDSTDQVNVTAAELALGPLADHGGLTETHALLPGSVAIDAGVNCPPPESDQRGEARPRGLTCDSGSYEFSDFLVVGIDIRPHSDANPIKPFARGVVPVAILTSESFDVADLDVATLAFGRGGAPPAFDLTNPWVFLLSHRDVNGDGKNDLLSHYRTEETGIAMGDTEACLTGETLTGTPIEGCDAINTVSCGLGVELVFLLPPLMWIRGRMRRHRQ